MIQPGSGSLVQVDPATIIVFFIIVFAAFNESHSNILLPFDIRVDCIDGSAAVAFIPASPNV